MVYEKSGHINKSVIFHPLLYTAKENSNGHEIIGSMVIFVQGLDSHGKIFQLLTIR